MGQGVELDYEQATQWFAEAVRAESGINQIPPNRKAVQKLIIAPNPPFQTKGLRISNRPLNGGQ